MRRTSARGRVFPQSFCTDRRIGRISVQAVALFTLIWPCCDDQGRIDGDYEEIKYNCVPNIDDIPKSAIPQLLEELSANNLVLFYDTPNGKALQMVDWWGAHNRLQWAWPSDYPPVDGWEDHLHYKEGATTAIKVNWPPPSRSVSGENGNGSQVRHQASEDNSSPEYSPEPSPEYSPEDDRESLPSPQTPYSSLSEKEKESGRGRGIRKSPEASGEKTAPAPAPTAPRRKLTRKEEEVYGELTESFRNEWGRWEMGGGVVGMDEGAGEDYLAETREPTYREKAQLRDLAIELAKLEGWTKEMLNEAFSEAVTTKKYSVWYVRKILLSWLGYGSKEPTSGG